MERDTAFQMAASNIRYGQGVTCEIGMDLTELDAKRALVIIDPALKQLHTGSTVSESIKQAGIDHAVYDAITVEPTDKSFQNAAEFATSGNFDAIVAVGGGSAIDTAKAANLYSTYPAEFLAYVNAPID